MVIAEDGMRAEGLLEKGYDWYVMNVKLQQETLNSPEFNGVLNDWKKKVERFKNKAPLKKASELDPATLTIGEIINSLKPAQLWAILGALAALVAGAFFMGGKIL